MQSLKYELVHKLDKAKLNQVGLMFQSTFKGFYARWIPPYLFVGLLKQNNESSLFNATIFYICRVISL